ncbi:MAG: hypothetical protein FWC56_04310 [Phycisphaerae bacterium]|nr:hypothetical protein [Phycisphaerae bacterium]
MNVQSSQAMEMETAFLAGAQHNLNQAKEQRFRGTQWLWANRSQEDKIREQMIARHCYDRALLRMLPKNAARVLTCVEPVWFFWKEPVAVAIAACWSPIEFYLDQQLSKTPVNIDGGSQVAQPMSLADLSAFVKSLVTNDSIPHLIGVCSPSGFTTEAKQLGLDISNVALVLIEPRPSGGWITKIASPTARPNDARLFDPEATNQKMQRIKDDVQAHRVELLTGGVRASTVADRLGVSALLVDRVFDELLIHDEQLRVSWHNNNDRLLYLGAPATLEESSMSMAGWFWQLFSGEGEETRKINALTERRAQLAVRRDRLYEDVSKLETREAQLMSQGRESSSQSVKRRVASQVKAIRDDMNRFNEAARMIGQQIDVISTHVHNLSLIQQGQSAKLPSSEEITQDAVRAEELLEQLNSETGLTSTLAPSGQETGLSNDEIAIFQELNGPASLPAIALPSAADEASSEGNETSSKVSRERKQQVGQSKTGQHAKSAQATEKHDIHDIPHGEPQAG